MPARKTIERARKDAREGKSPSTQAGEFVREEIHHIREGKHGARSPKQAIAIGLSKARKAGVRLPPKGQKAPKSTTRSRRGQAQPSQKRSHAISNVLKREPRTSASQRALSQQTRQTAQKRGKANRSRAALKAVQTKGKSGLRSAARKAAKSRQRASA